MHHLFSPSSLCYSFCALPRSRSWFMCGLAHKQHRNTNTFLLTVYLGNEVIKHASDVFPPSSACKSKIPDFLEYIKRNISEFERWQSRILNSFVCLIKFINLLLWFATLLCFRAFMCPNDPMSYVVSWICSMYSEPVQTGPGWLQLQRLQWWHVTLSYHCQWASE